MASPRQVSTLYSHIVRRPLSRALPRIRRRSSAWSCDNLSVGRGATTPHSCISTATTESAPYEPSFSALPFVRTPLSTPETVSVRPAYKMPPVAETGVVGTAGTLVEGAGSRKPVVGDGKADNKTEGGGSVEGAATGPFETPVEAIGHIEEPFLPDDPNQSFGLLGVRDSEPDVSLSRRIHILGFTAHARYLAHAIASTPDLPVSFFTHHPTVLSRWGQEHRQLSLYDSLGRYISSAAIPCPERIFDLRQDLSRVARDDYFLDNIIVDTTATAVLPSLATLYDRIDRRTTICLLHPGLDPVERPNFVLGHSTHRVRKLSHRLYSVKQRQSGVLYLYGVPRFEGSTQDKSSVTFEGSTQDKSSVAYAAMRQTQHFAQLLSSTNRLNVVSLPWVPFLTWKLPWLIFCSAADTLCVVLGCNYEEIIQNAHARGMWEDLLDETIAIIPRLPELQEFTQRIEYFTGNAFRRRLLTFLMAQRRNVSPWVKRVRMGDPPPIEYFNGYIIRRAMELGLDHKYNSMAFEAVKARVTARQLELQRDLLSTSPYMTDTDLIGGGQPAPTLEDTLRLELEDF
ncbi:hypothetical protein F4859DRAFT_505889 [Xylaria cf. heliscus]|nr:hypothetical protein F4859DRAFT_505889 [Xylaria cf. heliscus]